MGNGNRWCLPSRVRGKRGSELKSPYCPLRASRPDVFSFEWNGMRRALRRLTGEDDLVTDEDVAVSAARGELSEGRLWEL
jgi:hypothetical protein